MNKKLTILILLGVMNIAIAIGVHHLDKFAGYNLFPVETKEDMLANAVERIFKAAGPEYTGITVYIEDNDSWNAYATMTDQGEYIIVMHTGMLMALETEDEIALIVAHELAHHALGHVPSMLAGYMQFGVSAHHEKMADELGLYWTIKAGYDKCTGEKIWNDILEAEGDYIHGHSHPSPSQRASYLSCS